MSTPDVTSEVGSLRTVLLHRPGPELQRLTPRNNDALLFDGIPWVARAQAEHDAFAQLLRDRGVEVLLLSELLTDVLAVPKARADAIESTVADLRVGAALRRYLRGALDDLAPSDLASVLISGLRNDEISAIRTVVTTLLAPEDFLIDPLPNLLFTRDSSVWIGEQVVLTSLAMPARRRETRLTELIYTYLPRFAEVPRLHASTAEPIEGGDVLVLSETVLALGVGQRTSPAGVEALARELFASETARTQTILAVPIEQSRATMHLDTVVTMVDVDACVMYPAAADRLGAIPITNVKGELVVGSPRPFLPAAAQALGLDELRVIDTGLDPVTAEREQWDDGNNTLAIAPRVAIAYERNTQTNARLEKAGIEVLTVAGSELGSGRGGPRCMSCPIQRNVI